MVVGPLRGALILVYTVLDARFELRDEFFHWILLSWLIVALNDAKLKGRHW